MNVFLLYKSNILYSKDIIVYINNFLFKFINQYFSKCFSISL